MLRNDMIYLYLWCMKNPLKSPNLVGLQEILIGENPISKTNLGFKERTPNKDSPSALKA